MSLSTLDSHEQKTSQHSSDVKTILIVDALTEVSDLQAQLRRRRIRLLVEDDPLRAVARIAAGGVDLVVLCPELGADRLRALADLTRDELDTPTALAGADVALLGTVFPEGDAPTLQRPYQTREIAAILKPLAHPAGGGQLRVGHLWLSSEPREVGFVGETVRLSRLEAMVLAVLMRRPGRVITRDTIIGEVWPGAVRVDANDLLFCTVRRLRSKLGPIGVHDAIVTERGHGYRLDQALLR